MKRIGLLGGMSWSATATYYRFINTAVQQRLGGNHSAELLIHSFDFQALIDQLDRPAQIEAAMEQAALGLIRAGAEIIAVASLTGHRYASALARLPAPMIAIGPSVSAALDRASVRTVGVLATSTALRDPQLIAALVSTPQRKVVVPSDADMQDLDALIFGELAHMRLSSEYAERLAAIAAGMIARGAQAILMGTTEFSVVAERFDFGVPTLDAAALHCRDLVNHCLAGSIVSV